MFMSNVAFAADAAGQEPNILMQFFPLVLIVFIFYFISIRPQVKRQKQQVAMVSALKKGDVVITNSGIKGSVTKLQDDFVHIEIAKNVVIEVVKSAVTDKIENK